MKDRLRDYYQNNLSEGALIKRYFFSKKIIFLFSAVAIILTIFVLLLNELMGDTIYSLIVAPVIIVAPSGYLIVNYRNKKLFKNLSEAGGVQITGWKDKSLEDYRTEQITKWLDKNIDLNEEKLLWLIDSIKTEEYPILFPAGVLGFIYVVTTPFLNYLYSTAGKDEVNETLKLYISTVSFGLAILSVGLALKVLFFLHSGKQKNEE